MRTHSIAHLVTFSDLLPPGCRWLYWSSLGVALAVRFLSDPGRKRALYSLVWSPRDESETCFFDGRESTSYSLLLPRVWAAPDSRLYSLAVAVLGAKSLDVCDKAEYSACSSTGGDFLCWPKTSYSAWPAWSCDSSTLYVLSLLGKLAPSIA